MVSVLATKISQSFTFPVTCILPPMPTSQLTTNITYIKLLQYRSAVSVYTTYIVIMEYAHNSGKCANA